MPHYFVNPIDHSFDFVSELYNLIDPAPVLYRSLYSAIAETRPVIRYQFTLTGAPDGTTDAIIPISSLQCRHQAVDPTYLSVVIPYTSTYAGYITARPNGEMVVDMKLYTPGTLALITSAEIVRVDLSNVRIDKGGRNKSITLEGRKVTSWETQAITLTDCIYQMTDGGKEMFRFANPHIYLRPNDTLTVGTDTITVGEISYYVSVSDGGSIQQQMDVQEAD